MHFNYTESLHSIIDCDDLLEEKKKQEKLSKKERVRFGVLFPVFPEDAWVRAQSMQIIINC